MKQTAVQWFASKVMYLNINNSQMHDFLELFEEAREMETNQIKDAFDCGIWDGKYATNIKSEEYYKEIYKDK